MVKLSYFFLLGIFSILLFLPRSWPLKWRHLRIRVFLVVFGLWLISAGLLLVTFLRTEPFFAAVKTGNLEQAKQLLAKTPSLIHARTISIWSDNTALDLAIEKNKNEMVEFLLKAGADVNATDSAGFAPLDYAVDNDNIMIAKELLNAGANVNAAGGRDNDTALHAAAYRGYVDLVKLLLAHGADVTARNLLGRTALDLAEENQQTNVITVLINWQAKVK